MSDEEAVMSCGLVKTIAREQKVALFFRSQECGICEAVDTVKEGMGNTLKTPIITIEKEELDDIDCKSLADEAEIRAFPTVVLYKSGKPYHTVTFDGTENRKQIEGKLAEIDSA